MFILSKEDIHTLPHLRGKFTANILCKEMHKKNAYFLPFRDTPSKLLYKYGIVQFCIIPFFVNLLNTQILLIGG